MHRYTQLVTCVSVVALAALVVPASAGAGGADRLSRLKQRSSSSLSSRFEKKAQESVRTAAEGSTLKEQQEARQAMEGATQKTVSDPQGSGSGSSTPSPLDPIRTPLPTRETSSLDPQTGTVSDPVKDRLDAASNLAAPLPSAQELDEQAQAAKGDRTSQVSTIFRVNIHRDPAKVVKPIEPEPEPEPQDLGPDCDEDTDGQEFCDSDYTPQPDSGSGGEYTSKLTDAQLAARMAETKQGLVNPTEDARPLPDPDSLMTREESIRQRAGTLINPGTGDAGGLPSTDGASPDAPDRCDLARVAGTPDGECASGDGLKR
jgi:hypothetical protein